MRILQFFYNLIFPLGVILILPQYLLRMWKRGGFQNQLLQRFGIFDQASLLRIGKKRIWVHAVSVGEILIALKFIQRWKKKHPEARFLLSTTTTTGLAIAHKQASDWLEPIANPIDFFWITNKLLKQFQPAALMMIEGDVWPQRLFYSKKKKIPTALLTARLSPRSEKRMKRFQGMVSSFFNLIDLITLPSTEDQDRWLSLGINAARLQTTGNMKYDQQGIPSVEAPKERESIFKNLGWKVTDPVFLAGSTYNLEEEEILIKSWITLRKKFPDLRFIIAPRYVERRQEITELFKQRGVTVALRSQSHQEIAEALILDTTGELNSWYTVAAFVFVGKTLGVGGAHGGHNPVEPLVLGKPVLVGPAMENFEPLTSELRQARGIAEVRNEQEIVQVAENFLLHPEEATACAARGLMTLQEHQGSIDRTCEAVEKMLCTARQKSYHVPS